MPTEPPEPPHGPLDRAALTHAWLRVITATTYVPRTVGELTAELRGFLDTLLTALDAEPFDSDPGASVGSGLVAGGYLGVDALRQSIELLAESLPHNESRVSALLGALSAGYAEAVRVLTIDQQETMKLALLTAKHRAERTMLATESRLNEVFTSSAIGIAVSELDGVIVQSNPALGDILALRRNDLEGRRLDEFVGEDSAELRADYPGLLAGTVDRVRERRELLRHNDETAWVFITTSLLRDDDDQPRYRVTMVQDLSELQLLQDRLEFQLTHDVLTGTANRGLFTSKLETMHCQAGKGAWITLACLDLDAFSHVNDAYGHQAGDALLRTVARRLKDVVADEVSLVARIGGDEFAILIIDGPDTPDVAELVELINTDLTEPDYAAQPGLAVSASIGVVRCRTDEMSPAELFHAAESALRTARSVGRRQWAEYDATRDRAARSTSIAACRLPSAWENGELRIVVEPIVRLDDLRAIGLRAAVDLDGATPIDDRATTELTELTGMAALIGPWLLERAAEQAAGWRDRFTDQESPMCRLLLSPTQSADADLSATVNRAVAAAGIEPGLLEIALHTGAVLKQIGDARDNLRVLADIGVRVGLHEFTGGPREIGLVERSMVRMVLLADPFEGWRPDWLPSSSVLVRTTRELIAALRDSDVSVGVAGVRDHAEAAWWAEQGAHTGQGQAFGGSGLVEDVLARVGSGKWTDR